MNASLLRKRFRSHAAGRLALQFASHVYGAAVWFRNLLYRAKILPAKKLRARVVCIGNLTTGGTGKTSAVLLAAKTLRAQQVKTAILSRGYRRPNSSHEVQVLLNSHNVNWRETGDEPWMMHRALKGLEVPILVHPNRHRAGEEALAYYNPEVILLDDGFQHRRLKRDLDVVLINAQDPFGGGHLLPAGNLREPLSALNRAGLAVITHTDRVEKKRISEIRASVATAAPDLKIIESAHRADVLFDLKDDKRRRLAHIKGKTVALFSAIGHPQGFEDLIKKTGAHISHCWRYPDHHPFTQTEVEAFEAVRNGATLITTLKDFPRLPANWQEILRGEVLALGIRLEITKGKSLWEDALAGTKNAR
jgi:tetraacyldisaccharide 4'-kinase